MKAIQWIVIIMFLVTLTGCEMIVELPADSISENNEGVHSGGGIGRNDNSSTEVVSTSVPTTDQIIETKPEPKTEITTHDTANTVGMSFDVDIGEWIAISEPTESEVVEIDEPIASDFTYRELAVELQRKDIAIGRNIWTGQGNAKGKPRIVPVCRIIDVDMANGCILIQNYLLRRNPNRYELEDKEEWVTIDTIMIPLYYILK